MKQKLSERIREGFNEFSEGAVKGALFAGNFVFFCPSFISKYIVKEGMEECDLESTIQQAGFMVAGFAGALVSNYVITRSALEISNGDMTPLSLAYLVTNAASAVYEIGKGIKNHVKIKGDTDNI